MHGTLLTATQDVGEQAKLCDAIVGFCSGRSTSACGLLNLLHSSICIAHRLLADQQCFHGLETRAAGLRSSHVRCKAKAAQYDSLAGSVSQLESPRTQADWVTASVNAFSWRQQGVSTVQCFATCVRELRISHEAHLHSTLPSHYFAKEPNHGIWICISVHRNYASLERSNMEGICKGLGRLPPINLPLLS